MDTILKKLGVSESVFVITAKTAEEEAAKRFSHMFLLLQTLGILNLYCFTAAVISDDRYAICMRDVVEEAQREDARTVAVKAFVLPLFACTCTALL